LADISTQLLAVWHAPIPFVLALFACIAMVWSVQRWRYDSVVENLKSKLELMETALGQGSKSVRNSPAAPVQISSIPRPTEANGAKTQGRFWFQEFQEMTHVQQMQYIERNNNSHVSISGMLKSAKEIGEDKVLVYMSIEGVEKYQYILLETSGAMLGQINTNDKIFIEGVIGRTADMLSLKDVYVRRAL